MKLTRQTRLHFKQGASDKVYEVDLCEVGAGRYVVNFRYGRRGSALKEGTKTAAPVSLTEADKIYSKLVAAKTKEGYLNAGTGPGQPSPRPAGNFVKGNDADARAQAVLRQLNEAANAAGKKTKSKWPLDRVIWRAGELKLREAAPTLISLIGGGQALRDYCLAWSLGRCGDANAIPAIRQMLADSAPPEFVRQIACEALLRLLDKEAKTRQRSEWIEELPSSLRLPARNGSPEIFQAALAEYLNGSEAKRFDVLTRLYLIDNDTVRPALLETLRSAPLRPGYFRAIRSIFKAAEYRCDAEIFGILAYRFEKERAMFRRGYWGYASQNVDGQWVKVSDEIKKPDSRLAYSDRTRGYLRRRVWRTLRRLGELGEAQDYVKMAVGALLPFSDADAQPARQTERDRYEYDRATRQMNRIPLVRARWDQFAGYYAFNHILYLNSPRYELKPNSVAFRCRANYKPGDPEPAAREEAFPKLWEQHPVGLLHLLSESDCRPVHHFAVKALRECREFCDRLDVEVVTMLLGRPYEITSGFGFEIARRLYRADAPDPALVLAVANCSNREARAAAHRWIDEGREHFLNDSAFLASLIASPQGDTREFARTLLLSATLAGETAQALIGRTIVWLLRQQSSSDAARGAAETIHKCFGPPLRRLGLDVVLDLLAHPLLEVQELGGQILLNHETPAGELPETIIHSLIASHHESMRGIGLRLFGQLPEERLLRSEKLLIDFSTHELTDIRNVSRPVIRRLCADGRNPEFAAWIAGMLIELLQRREAHEGVHLHLARLLREDVGSAWIAAIEKETVVKLLQMRSPAAQDFGGWLLQTIIGRNAAFAEGFETHEIVKLSSHEIKSVREAAQIIFLSVISRFTRAANPSGCEEEMMSAVHLLDARWDDAREFYFRAFRERLTAEEFTPSVLVAICDSVREDVQQFGRELITKHFADEGGQEYLLKLSEHPSADLQLFATNYLERFASGNPQRLRGLRHYFISVLSRVNRARVAKSRVLAFLAAEARKSADAAAVVAEILTRQSVTIAVGDRAAAIEMMLGIRRQYPEIELPIQVKAVQLLRTGNHGVGHAI